MTGGSREVEPGYAVVEGELRTGDEIRLDLPMVSRWTLPDRRIDGLRGSAAVERGPLVYCAESVAGEPSLADVSVRTSTGHAGHTERVVDGVVEIDVEVMLTEQGSDAWPYGSPRGAAPEPAVADVAADPQDGTAAAGTAKAVLRLVPYHRWGNRGPAAMRVWLPVSD